MSYTLLVSSSAARDVAEARAYHARYGKAEAFIASVDRAFDQIAERPLMYPAVYEGVRRALLRRFPYSVFFVIDGDHVSVLGVHHQRRDPASRPSR
jgi:plasmid stabilization system protein ParE